MVTEQAMVALLTLPRRVVAFVRVDASPVQQGQGQQGQGKQRRPETTAPSVPRPAERTMPTSCECNSAALPTTCTIDLFCESVCSAASPFALPPFGSLVPRPSRQRPSPSERAGLQRPTQERGKRPTHGWRPISSVCVCRVVSSFPLSLSLAFSRSLRCPAAAAATGKAQHSKAKQRKAKQSKQEANRARQGGPAGWAQRRGRQNGTRRTASGGREDGGREEGSVRVVEARRGTDAGKWRRARRAGAAEGDGLGTHADNSDRTGRMCVSVDRASGVEEKGTSDVRGLQAAA
jgi:hypothetical protein